MKSIEQGWYNGSAFNYLLAPLSLLFYLVSCIRRWGYRTGLFKTHRVGCPVIVVGNISVGGNGKTPFVVHLVQQLQQQGLKVGVISRGYGGDCEHYPAVVENGNAAKYGDEPVLICNRTDAPVVVGPNRVENCRLLRDKFGCEVIVSDDGLQHYRLARDMEIVIVDGARGFGNGWVMPVGPLRELPGRLKSVDHVIYNGTAQGKLGYRIKVDAPVRVLDDKTIPDQQILNQPVHVVCGIGNPARFETSVAELGVQMSSFTAFADHHRFSAEDFARFGEAPVLMTEKDAVKCRTFARPNWWYLPISIELPSTFEHTLLNSIQRVVDTHGI